MESPTYLIVCRAMTHVTQLCLWLPMAYTTYPCFRWNPSISANLNLKLMWGCTYLANSTSHPIRYMCIHITRPDYKTVHRELNKMLFVKSHLCTQLLSRLYPSPPSVQLNQILSNESSNFCPCQSERWSLQRVLEGRQSVHAKTMSLEPRYHLSIPTSCVCKANCREDSRASRANLSLGRSHKLCMKDTDLFATHIFCGALPWISNGSPILWCLSLKEMVTFAETFSTGQISRKAQYHLQAWELPIFWWGGIYKQKIEKSMVDLHVLLKLL